MAWRIAAILVLTFRLGDSRRRGLENTPRPGTLASLDTSGKKSDPTCQKAKADPENQWRFILDYEHSAGVRHNEEYVLRAEAECDGDDIAKVSVIPKIDADDPLQKSQVVITMEPKVLHQRVYVCRVRGPRGRCIASLMPPSHSFRPHQLLMGLPVIKKSRRLLDLHLGETNPAVDILEWIMFLIVLCFLGATGHAIYELAFGMKLTDIVGGGANLRGPSRRAIAPNNDSEAPDAEPCPIDISSPFWEAVDAWVNSSSFVVACVSLLSVLLSILVNADGPPTLMVLTILWPVSCGNFLLYCFWMSTCRLQLYSAALTRGICIRGEDPTSPTLILMGGCISVLVLCAATTALMLLSGQMNDGMTTARKISPYVINPITSLSSIFVFLYFRSLAHHKTQRPMAIDAMVQLLSDRDKEDGRKKVSLATVPNTNGACIASQLKAGSVPIISEGAFCELCRQGKDPVMAIEEAVQNEEDLPDGPSFLFADLGWQGRMVYHLSGYSVAILNTPVAVFFFLTLTAASVCLAIVCLTTQPSINSFDTSQNSLGRLNPELRPWQTDYELVLDQTAHSYTFLATLPQEGTSEMQVNLPGREDAHHVSSRSCMLSVLLDGTTYPMFVDLVATGIWSRQRTYQLSVVKHYELVLAMHIQYMIGRKKPVGRVVLWGEVEGSVFSMPMNVGKVRITLFHGSYSMGIPIREEEAEAERNRKKVVTVFKTHTNSTEATCNELCRITARCLKSQPGKHGCFLLWGPSVIDERVFEDGSGKDKFIHHAMDERLCDGCLGASLCMERKGAQACKRMKPTSSRLLTAKTSWYPEYQQREIQIRLHERFDSREVVDYDQPKLILRDSPPRPVEVLSFATGGLETSTVMDWEVQGPSRLKKGTWRITVTIKKYLPSTYKAPLELYLAILLPDNDSLISLYKGRTPFEMANESTNELWAEKCQESAAAKQYSICGGWRHSNVVKSVLQPWLPTATDYIPVQEPSRKQKKLIVKVKTEDNVAPAIWSIEDSCSLDMEAIDFVKAEQVLTLKTYEQLIEKCKDRVYIQFKGNFQLNMTVAEVAREALNKYGGDDHQLVRIVESVDTYLFKNKFSDQGKAEYYQSLGFGKAMNPPWKLDLGVGFDSSFKMFSLKTLLQLARPPAPRGGYVETFCEFFTKEELKDGRGQEAFITTIDNSHGKSRGDSLTAAIVRCLKDKGVKTLPLNPHELSPLMYAAKMLDASAVKDVLGVTSCCSVIDDGSNIGAGFLETAVAFGCSQCLKTYLASKHCRAQVDRSALVFTAATSVDTWGEAKNVANAFQELDELSQVSFKGSGVPLHRLLFKLMPVARLNGLLHVRRLSFNEEIPSRRPLLDASTARRLCALFEGIQEVTELFPGVRMNPDEVDIVEEFLGCLPKLPRLKEIEIAFENSAGLQPDWIASLLRRSPTLRKIYLSGASSSKKLAEALEESLPNVTVESIRHMDHALRPFDRMPCVPRTGFRVDHMKVW